MPQTPNSGPDQYTRCTMVAPDYQSQWNGHCFCSPNSCCYCGYSLESVRVASPGTYGSIDRATEPYWRNTPTAQATSPQTQAPLTWDTPGGTYYIPDRFTTAAPLLTRQQEYELVRARERATRDQQAAIQYYYNTSGGLTTTASAQSLWGDTIAGLAGLAEPEPLTCDDDGSYEVKD